MPSLSLCVITPGAMSPVSALYQLEDIVLMNYSEGELHIRSKLISRGYHNDSLAFSIDSDGVITSQTGDVYERIPIYHSDPVRYHTT
jgi:hypothetical protein